MRQSGRALPRARRVPSSLHRRCGITPVISRGELHPTPDGNPTAATRARGARWRRVHQVRVPGLRGDAFPRGSREGRPAEVSAGAVLTPAHSALGAGPAERGRGRAAEQRVCLQRASQGVRLARKMQVCPCIRAGIQLEKAGVDPTSGPTRRLFSPAGRSPRPTGWPDLATSGEAVLTPPCAFHS